MRLFRDNLLGYPRRRVVPCCPRKHSGADMRWYWLQTLLRLRHCLISTVALLISVWATQAAASSESESLRSLAERGFHNLYGKDYLQTLELITFDSKGSQVSRRVVQVVRAEEEEKSSALMRFLEPRSLEGTSLLFTSDTNAGFNVFAYLPSLRTTRRMSGAMKSDSFFGTTLSFSDFEPKEVADYTVQSRGSNAGSDSCTSVQLRARQPDLHDHIHLCVREKDGSIEQMAFSKDGSVHKVLVADPDEVRTVGSRIVPFLFTVQELPLGPKTTVRTISYRAVKHVRPALFTLSNLERGDAVRDRRFVEAGAN